MARVRAAHPYPGRLIDIGGYRVHLLAEGEANGKRPVIWFGGSHSMGYALHHLHAAMREETRSIVIDRPGTGWSDTGPFPRTTPREAQEMIEALERSGEVGPFVFAGHSFGGLLVANIARRRPDLVATLVLLDATPLDTIVYGPPVSNVGKMSRDEVRNGLRRMFGMYRRTARGPQVDNPEMQRIVKLYSERLGDAQQVIDVLDSGTRSAFAAASIYTELTPAGVAANGWELSIYDGDLSDVDVVLVAPSDVRELKEMPEIFPAGSDGERMGSFFRTSRERYMMTSNNARRVYAPAGTGHNFPFERPDFVLDLVRTLL